MKPGAKVRCVFPGTRGPLEKDKLYTASIVTEGLIELHEFPGLEFGPWRFEEVEDDPVKAPVENLPYDEHASNSHAERTMNEIQPSLSLMKCPHCNGTGEVGHTLGRAVAAYREAKGLTRAQLAEKAEVSASTLGNLENDRSDPSVSLLRRVAAALDCPLSALLRDDA